MKLDISTRELDDAASRWRRRADKIAEDAARTIAADAAEMVTDARAETPVRTGELRAAWRAEPDADGVDLHNPTPWAGFVLTDVQPIRARISKRIPNLSEALVRRIHRRK